MRTGAHMADTGTEHNIELIVGVSQPRNSSNANAKEQQYPDYRREGR